jgi:hypothetical protein
LLLANLTNLKYALLMALRPEDLPSDPARLIEIVLSLDAENDRLRAVIGTFKDMIFGSRSEKLCAVPRDNQGETAASIMMRMRRGWTDGARA